MTPSKLFAAVAVATLGVAAACVAPLEERNLPCPCSNNQVCCQVTNTCANSYAQCPTAPPDGGPAVADDGGSDGTTATVDAHGDAASFVRLPGDLCEGPAWPPSSPSASASPTVRMNIGDSGTTQTTLTGQTFFNEGSASYARNYTLGSRCVPADGPERTYLVYGVTGGQQLTAGLVPHAGFDGVVNIVPVQQNAQGELICSQALGCTIGATTRGEGTHLAVSTGEQPLWVVVTAKDPNPTGTYDLVLQNSLALSGDADSCATAMLVAPGTRSVDLGSARNHYGDDRAIPVGGGPCTGFAGPDRAYRLQSPIAAGSGLRAEVAPGANQDVTVTIVEGSVSACDSSTERCLRVANAGGPGVREAAEYKNESDGPKSVFVLVDSPDPEATGTVTLTITALP
jgi:hypothetical protein